MDISNRKLNRRNIDDFEQKYIVIAFVYYVFVSRVKYPGHSEWGYDELLRAILEI